jgi:hypothetical protein
MTARKVVQCLVVASLVVAQAWAAYCTPSCQPVLAERCCRAQPAPQDCCCTLQAKGPDTSNALLTHALIETPAVLSHRGGAPPVPYRLCPVTFVAVGPILAFKVELDSESPRGPPAA